MDNKVITEADYLGMQSLAEDLMSELDDCRADKKRLEAECERLTHIIDTLRAYCRPVDITAAYMAIGEKEPT